MIDASLQTRRSQIGAVHTMWLVVILILWLATLALLYVTNSEIAGIEASRDQARAQTATADAKFDEEFERFRAVSDVVGYTDPANIASRTNIAALQVDLDAAKAAVGNVLGGADSSVTAEQAIKALLSAHQAAIAARDAAKTALAGESAARAAADKRTQQLQADYESQIDGLRQDLADEQQRSATQAGNYDRQLADLRGQQQAADDTARSTQRALDDAQIAAAREKSNLEAVLSTLALDRAVVEPEAPDGEILAVSADGTLAWIDIGGRNSLRRGTRFEVLRSTRGGDYTHQGTVEVREVEEDMATVGLIGEPDPYDPLLMGDRVRNPHFNRHQQLSFHLLGEFPLSMSKEFVTGRLTSLGAVVDAELETTTDVLVLGSKNLAEGEFAVELDETDEYRMAEKLGMRIIRLSDLSDFLRL